MGKGYAVDSSQLRQSPPKKKEMKRMAPHSPWQEGENGGRKNEDRREKNEDRMERLRERLPFLKFSYTLCKRFSLMEFVNFSA